MAMAKISLFGDAFPMVFRFSHSKNLQSCFGAVPILPLSQVFVPSVVHPVVTHPPGYPTLPDPRGMPSIRLPRAAAASPSAWAPTLAAPAAPRVIAWKFHSKPWSLPVDINMYQLSTGISSKLSHPILGLRGCDSRSKCKDRSWVRSPVFFC